MLSLFMNLMNQKTHWKVIYQTNQKQLDIEE